MKLVIHHVSDSHGFHEDLDINTNVDVVIHSGDESNSSLPAINANECLKFLDWYEKVEVEHKILVPGNHSTAIAAGLITKEDCAKRGITLLHQEWIDVKGFKIWGSGLTPQFGNWAFMKPRGKLAPYYAQAPTDTDVWVQHGPPKGVLDLSRNRSDVLEMCGCKELLNALNIVRPLAMLFGHIHNFKDCINTGILEREGTIYSNATAVTDAKFDLGVTFNGNLITIEK